MILQIYNYMFLLIPWNNMINADTCFLVTQKVWYLYSLKQEYAILLSIKYYFLNMMFREGNGNLLQYSCLENPRTEEPGRLQSTGSLRVGHDWATPLSLSCIGEGDGDPLQCSCLENPRDARAWWAAVCGVAQLKWLSSSSKFFTTHLTSVTSQEP